MYHSDHHVRRTGYHLIRNIMWCIPGRTPYLFRQGEGITEVHRIFDDFHMFDYGAGVIGFLHENRGRDMHLLNFKYGAIRRKHM